ncbi:sporulation protein YqfC [Bacillus carboniphilus]|uniref:Sporulation protein YqfC n=1 Tax=Bacillus carboniphilus TaxID=86663 RepID=A0ABY9JX53_9BACI|nr:sporulation protein YqfC [Bacillus carboniphilus]WLR43987.1 sporulation protein YqfC [Bacillus carboniphilus]
MSNNWRKKLSSFLTNSLELPSDVMMNMPRITLVGQLHIYIENHKGLLTFSDKELRLMLYQGQLQILGEGFVIKTILSDEILLQGTIEKVIFLDE